MHRAASRQTNAGIFADVPTDPPANLAAALADRYELRRPLGRGGMATVYHAYDRRHDRDVAIKVLLPGLAAHLGAERFVQEIRIAARLTHPHILTVYDSGEASGFLFYVMPYLPGPSLRQRITDGRPFAVAQAVAIAAPVADALGYAHRMGVLHRDIKPENILFAEDHAIVADFGIAKAITTASGGNLTRTGFSLGTPGYMSPEQAAGLTDLDERADVYSLAVVIYEMVVGEIPPLGHWATDETVRAGRLGDAPGAHRARLDALGRGVEAALVRGLALHAELRPATPTALVRELVSMPSRDPHPLAAGPHPPATASPHPLAPSPRTRRGGTAGESEPPPRQYGESEVQAIVRRAAELEASRPTTGQAMTMGGIEALGAEVGLSPELLREAAQTVGPLGPAPRELSGTTHARFREVAYSAWQLMDPTNPPDEGWGLTDLLSVIFFSVLTAGILPMVFFSLASSRKRRLRGFFRNGSVTTAEIIEFRDEAVGFDVKLTRVRYEFTADGRTHRGSDVTLPVVADRWRIGDRIEILYLPGRNYDSVIATRR
jgi:serine/threonine protein kinase